MRASDIDGLLSIFTDPNVMGSFNIKSFSREQMEMWLQRNLAHQEKYGYGLFSVILKSNDVLIGDCGLEHMMIGNVDMAELGYDFHSSYWNQGYATEAATAVRNYSFKELNLPRLVSLVRIGNLASRRVAEKIGMHLAAEIIRNDQRYWKYSIARVNEDE
jgi:RimJ/RimL family protein N-acetyltransferase